MMRKILSPKTVYHPRINSIEKTGFPRLKGSSSIYQKILLQVLYISYLPFAVSYCHLNVSLKKKKTLKKKKKMKI